MGILQPLKAFAHALIVVHNNHPITLQTKLKHLACFFLLEYEIQEPIRNHSSLICYSIDKMQKNMEFLVHTVRLPTNIFVSNLTLLTLSLKTGIEPRYVVYKFISEM